MHSVPNSSLEYRRRLRFVNRQRVFHAGDRLIIFAEKYEKTAERIQTLGDARIASAQQLGSNRHRLFGELSPLRVLIGIATQQREVIRTLGVVECVFADFRLANFKRLPQRGFTGFQVARRVDKESEPIETMCGLFGIGRRGHCQFRDSNRFREVALRVGHSRLAQSREDQSCAPAKRRENQRENEARQHALISGLLRARGSSQWPADSPRTDGFAMHARKIRSPSAGRRAIPR